MHKRPSHFFLISDDVALGCAKKWASSRIVLCVFCLSRAPWPSYLHGKITNAVSLLRLPWFMPWPATQHSSDRTEPFPAHGRFELGEPYRRIIDAVTVIVLA